MNWQPIETAPRDGQNILMFPIDNDGKDDQVWIGWWNGVIRNWDCMCGLRRSHEPTHWMPLPSPPEPSHVGGSSPSEAKGVNP